MAPIVPVSRGLFIRTVAEAPERTISPPLHFYIGPRWSPDGRTIYVHGTTPTEEFGVLQIDAVTGAIVSSRLGESFFLAALSRDGTTYIAAQDGRIVEHDLTSNRKTSVPLPASAGKPLYVALSPDEKWLAFSTNNGPDGRSLAVVPRQGGQPRVLVRVASPEFVQLEVWTQDGQSLLFGKGRAPNGQTGSVVDLWRVDVASGHSEAIGLSKVGLREVRLHPDGRRFAFTAGWPTREIWVMENFLPSPATNTH
jgi:Tol biopolymer transport system component